MYLTIAPIIDKPQIEYLYTILFLLVGVIFYVPFVKRKYAPVFISKYTFMDFRKFFFSWIITLVLLLSIPEPLTTYLQILLEVSPTTIPLHEIEIQI